MGYGPPKLEVNLVAGRMDDKNLNWIHYVQQRRYKKYFLPLAGLTVICNITSNFHK